MPSARLPWAVSCIHHKPLHFFVHSQNALTYSHMQARWEDAMNNNAGNGGSREGKILGGKCFIKTVKLLTYCSLPLPIYFHVPPIPLQEKPRTPMQRALHVMRSVISFVDSKAFMLIYLFSYLYNDRLEMQTKQLKRRIEKKADKHKYMHKPYKWENLCLSPWYTRLLAD